MRASNSGSIPPPLRGAADRFDRWRSSHERGTRIPDRLWHLATELAATYGVSRTSIALKLEYYSLKRRLADFKHSSEYSAATSPESCPFVELPTSNFGASGECIIDLENSRGAKMRIHCKGIPPDLVALSRSFWSAE